ncbi:hypothetical protein Lfu02_02740 [Longispora fulva]|uniref:BNR/Asp-box repeat protein n=1 Tax=Longispora fulva TaxID=619741 RepID=A0A8J7GMQ1_9ACTN|nr:hypothetical protein [Longispora fulva]MBG6135854.1 hypothetical protein [Longispora fulva]GIG55902.1 hypothetical protein Lfu02_02740 [Longispora fulva]
MRKLATGLFTALTATVATLSMTAGSATAATTWTINPTCSTVTGPGALTYTTDDGATLHATTGTPVPTTYTHGLVALDTANTLLAVQVQTTGGTTTRTVYRSTDAGCSWASIGTLPGGWTLRTTAAKGGRAYVWTPGGDSGFVLVDGTTLTTNTDPTIAEPAPADGLPGLIGVGVDPANGLHVYAARRDGQIFESTTGGASWTKRGGLFPVDHYGSATTGYQVAFDPTNPLHAVAGTMQEGVIATFNGGVTWTKIAYDETTHPNSRYGVNAFAVAISPADPNVVYVQSLDLSQATADGDEGKQIRRSTDGGLTFGPAIVHHVAGNIMLQNGTPMFPSPADAGVLYFSYGTSYQNYGNDLFRYSVATGTLTRQHDKFHGLNAVAFNPTNPATLYLGLAVEGGGL